MSDTTPKQYAPIDAKEIQLREGALLKLSFKADALIEWLKGKANEKGYVNLCVSKRKQVGQYGDTHTVSLDTWKPDPNKQGSRRPEPAREAPVQKPVEDSNPVDEDSIPF